jgi:hypothetical protein
MDNDKICIICYDKVGTTKYNTICSCNFYYHQDCYLEWININSICLICRKSITKTQVLETINPLCLNIPEVRAYLEINQNVANSLENSNSISSENSENDILSQSCLTWILIMLGLFIMLFLVTFVYVNT